MTHLEVLERLHGEEVAVSLDPPAFVTQTRGIICRLEG